MPTPPSLFSEYSEPTADAGSDVLGPPSPYCEARENAEYCDPAEVGPLVLPSKGPKLPDLECAALLSLPPLADCPAVPCDGALPICDSCSWGVLLLPMGVANCSRGSDGREGIEPGICRVSPPFCGWPMPLTGLTFGEGGMASPNLIGVLAPPFARLPGIGGRSSGAGLDILGGLFDSTALRIFVS